MQRTLPRSPPERSRMEQRLARSTRIPLRRRLRFAYRALAAWLGRFAAADGHAAAARESTAQLAAREAGERKAAIDGSIGAMSPADIRRFINPAGMDETGHIARR